MTRRRSAAAARRRDPLPAQRQAMRRLLTLNNVSKLTQEDAERFEDILSLVFADVPKEEQNEDPICSALETSFETLHLINNKSQIQKCTEIYEQLQQRMGVVIVGPPGSGKTTIRRLLKSALTSQGKNIVEYVICPKAMSRNSLLGHIDHDTRQWTDGVISSTALEVSNQPSDIWSWVVCDGDIDPEWIEALNSVLDDNRLLTLPSGWRIQFGSNVNFIFETHSLEHASPATVSRMGIILLNEESSCAQEVLDNWMRKIELENDASKVGAPLLQRAIKKCLEWFRANQSNVLVKSYDFSLVKQIITQFEYITQNMGPNINSSIPEDIAYFAIERSVMGIIKENSIDSFHQELSDTLGTPPTSAVSPEEWVSENLYLSRRLADREPAVRACALSQDSHLLLIGPDASAKSALIEYVVKETNLTAITIDCTPLLEPGDIIAELKRNNAVRSGGGYGGGDSGGGRLALVVRSLDRASSDSWRCSAVHQFLLQLIQHGGFWSRGGDEGGATWCRVARLQLLATAAAPPNSPRLAAALAHVAVPEPDDEELLELIKNYLKQNVDKNVSEKDVADIATNMLAMFKEVTETFYSQPHYKWNADHLRQWCENVRWYSPANSTDLIMGIQEEANSIFRDRLVTDEEKGRYNAISRNFLKTNTKDTIYFAPKLKADGIYMEAMEYNDWYQRTQKLINQCLSENENVFGDSGAEVCAEIGTLCSSMARACRGGIGLSVIVGSAGVGRRAAAHLTAAQLPATLAIITHQQHFYSHMKNALNSAGEGTRTLVLICESAAEASQLSSIEALHAAASVHAVPARMMPAQNSPHMLQNIKQNLGIVICLDKDQENVWELIDKYPLLYNYGHVVWLERWSDDTLRQMPSLVIQRLVKESITEVSKEELQTIPTEGFVKIYESLEANWLRAPCRYINFIKTYFNLVNRKKQALTQRQNMLSAGVEALRKARSEVATLQAEAAEQKAALAEKQESANRALEQIAATVRANTDQREEMHALKNNIETENEKLQIRKKEIETELASVEPVIAAARAAVGDIRPESLSEIRSLRAPPDVVRDVLEGVLRLMGIADTSWHSMKNFLSKRGVKEDIRCMDASQISPEAAESVEKLLKTRGSSFEPATAKRASAACAPLAAWVRANLAYAAAAARVRPLQAQQARLHKNLVAAEEQLHALSSGLATVEERVAALQQQLGQHSRDAAALELSLSNATSTITAATALIATLAQEYDAWETDLENISREIVQLNSRSLLAAAYVVYLPDVTEQQARQQLKKWGSLIGFDDESFSVLNFLSTPEKQLKWEADGLPSDSSAIKNAVLIDQVLQAQRCGLTPLVIDPDGEAIAWLKNTLAESQCDFVSQHSEKLLTTVQYAVRLGRTLVITDVDGIHQSWAPLLLGGGGLLLVSVGARLPPPHAARLSPLPFTARLEALTDQLVFYALQRLNPEVNEKSKEIKLKKATLQKQQYELQENLLRDLSKNNDILHDANLLASLNKTRETGATIAEALAAAHAISASTRAACDTYRPSAARVASLALAVKRLAVHRPLLALPVDVVLDVYVDALRRGDPNKIDNDEVIKFITRRIIERVLLGLHKKDKYIIVLHILKQVYSEAMPDKLWQLFLGNVIGNDEQRNIDEIKKMYTWIPTDRINRIVQLKTVDEDLFNKLSLQKSDLWTEFLSSGDLNVVSRLRLNSFEAVVAIAALRPDTLYRAIIAFVDELLGAGWWGGSEAVSAAARWSGRARPALVLAPHAADVLAAHARARRTTLTSARWSGRARPALVLAPHAADVLAAHARARRTTLTSARWSGRARPALVLAPHAADVLAAHARARRTTLTSARWSGRARPALVLAPHAADVLAAHARARRTTLTSARWSGRARPALVLAPHAADVLAAHARARRTTLTSARWSGRARPALVLAPHAADVLAAHARARRTTLTSARWSGRARPALVLAPHAADVLAAHARARRTTLTSARWSGRARPALVLAPHAADVLAAHARARRTTLTSARWSGRARPALVLAPHAADVLAAHARARRTTLTSARWSGRARPALVLAPHAADVLAAHARARRTTLTSARWSGRARPALVLAPHAADVLAAHARARRTTLTSARWSGRARPALVLAPHAADVLAAHARARRTTLTQVGVEEGLHAWEAAVEAARGGGWLALLVGASPFTGDLHSFVAAFVQRPPEDFSEEFRLWIVSEDREIPPLIANACVNVILEAPEGVKHNALGTLAAWGGYEAAPALVRAHACLALFHAVLQERRAYIPQGWTQWYAWEWGEVCASAEALRAGGAGARALVLALYAARAGSEADRAALRALHNATLGDHVLAHDARPLGLPLRLPHATRTQEYSSAFEALPQIDTPEILGLPANCRIAWERNAANDIINGLKELDSTTSSQENNKNNVTPLKMILALWKKLMSGSPLLKADYKIDRMRGWWGSVCASEAREAARAARGLHLALAVLARQATRAPPLHKVPEEWQALWAGPERPEEYVREFCARARAALERLDAPFADDYLPAETDLRGWLRPARALWALRAVSAARLRTAPHDLTLAAKWDCKEVPAEGGLVIVGLVLGGAAWAGALAPPAPAAPPAAPAPPLLLRYLPTGGEISLRPEGTAQVPLYASAARETALAWLRAPLARPLARPLAALHAVALAVAPAAD
ncbi:cytoplasmic dynein 2 heavy chain 1-like [Ostrinia nubilalis]|uniref:cytoplasmic dynein 2 heavy chain 1-like n=1 Tax=Ostrinia nubilalis TaxID=29057 RepID=UPI00308252D7